MKRSLLVIAISLACGCRPSPYPTGGVNPAPPGPVDVVRSMWGDYSGRCPNGYQYCTASSQSICCPFGEGCAEDSGAAYCVRRTSQRSAGYGEPDHASPTASCLTDEITCSYAGRVACCPSSQRCCATTDGPACCDGP